MSEKRKLQHRGGFVPVGNLDLDLPGVQVPARHVHALRTDG